MEPALFGLDNGVHFTVLPARVGISQMDVPTRQAYTMAVVRPDERSAAAGVTGVARSVGASISPVVATILMGSAGRASVPFFLAGGLKIVYDVLLYRAFAGSKGGTDSKEARCRSSPVDRPFVSSSPASKPPRRT